MATQTADLYIKAHLQSDVNKELKTLESSIIRTVGAITAAFATISVVLYPVKKAVEFERAMADVAKTTGYADEDIKRLTASLREMSTELGTTALELANVAAIAGQLGLGDQGRKAIESFTESVARASVTLGISVEKTAEGGAQLSAIFGKSVSEVEKVFSSINELSNNSVAAGGDLIDIMKRVGTTSNATLQEVAGLAATMRQLGVPNEQAGTGLVKFLSNMLAESKKFSEAMGLSQGEWVDKVKANSVEALQYVLTELSNMGSAQQAALTKSLFGSGRLFSAATKLVGDASNGFEVLNRMMGLSVDGYREGTSSLEEYERIMDTTAKQLDVLGTSFSALGIRAGTVALSAIQKGIEGISEALQTTEMQVYFDTLGDGLTSMVNAVKDAASYVANLDIEWTNVINTLKILLGLKLGAVLLGWGKAIALLAGAHLLRLVVLFGKVNVILRGLGATIVIFSSLLRAQFIPSVAAAGTTMAASGAAAQSFATRLGLLWTSLSVGTAKTPLIVRALGALRVAFIGLMGALGPLGVVLGLASLAIYSYWDEITTLLGFVNKEEARRKRASDALEQEAKNKRDAILADTKEYVKRLEQIYKNRGDTKEEGFQLKLTSESDTKFLQSAIKDYALVLRAHNTATEAIEINNQAILDASKKLLEAKDGVIKAERDLFNANSLLDIEGFEVESGELSTLEDNAKKAEAALYRAQAGVKKLTLEHAQYAKALALTNEPAANLASDLSQRLDASQAYYLQEVALLKRYQADIAATQEEIATLEKDTKKGTSEKTAGRVNDDDIIRLNHLYDQITPVQQKIEELEASTQKLFDGLSKTQQQNILPFKEQDAENISNIVTELYKLKEAVAIGDGPATQAREHAAETIFNYLAQKKLKEGIEQVESATKAYAKTAKSVFNNTANEIIALNRRVAQFAIDFKNSLATRKIDLKLKLNLENIDEEYEKAKASINDKWDKLEEAQKVNGRFSVYLGGYRKNELAELELQKTRDKANAEAKAAVEKYNQALERSKKLTGEAKKAAAEGNLDKAFALKDSAKRGIDDAHKLIEEMRSIETVNILGKDSFKFNDVELDKLVTKAAEVSKAMGEELSEINIAADQQAQTAANAVSKAADKIRASFTDAETKMNNLKIFENLEGLTSSMTQLMDTSADRLKEVIKDMKGSSAGVYNVGDLPDFTQIGQQITAGLSVDLDKTVTSEVKLGVGTALKDQAGPVSYLAKQLGDAVGAEFAAAAEFAADHSLGVDISSDIASQGVAIQEALDSLPTPKHDVSLNPIFDLTQKEFEDLIIKAQGGVDATYEPTVKPNTKDLSKDIQEGINDGNPYELEVKANVTGDIPTNFRTPQALASGGPVFGAGTATSDSIPAWLSNGEWVIDAFTTKFFGGSFFTGLQALARGKTRIPSMKGGLPAFAEGGPVGQFFNGSGAGTRDSVDLNFNIGNNSFQVSGEREQVEGLVSAMKYITG